LQQSRSEVVRSALAGFVLICVVCAGGAASSQSSGELDALNRKVTELDGAGRYAEAIPLAEKSLQLTRAQLGDEHIESASRQGWLAHLYSAQGRFAEAGPLYMRSLAITEKAEGADGPTVATILNNLAGVYEYEGRYSQAEPLARRALGIAEKREPDSTTVATYLNNLGRLITAQGRYEEAEPLIQRSLILREKLVGPDHAYVGSSLLALADLYERQDRLAEAEQLYRRAVVVFEKAYGQDHRYVGHAVAGLAKVVQRQGRHAESLPLYQRSIDILEKALGPDHPDLAVALNNQGMRLHGSPADAEAAYKRALGIYERVYGTEHPNVATTLNNLAFLYRQLGRYAEAEGLMQRSLALRAKALGSDHPSLMYTFANRAVVAFEQKRWSEVLSFGRQALAIAIAQSARTFESVGRPQTGVGSSAVSQSSISLNEMIKAASRLAAVEPAQQAALARETFEIAQWVLGSGASESLAQMAARQAKGDAALARLVRERQDLVGEWRGRDKALIAAVSRPKDERQVATVAGERARLAAIDARISEIDKVLMRDFPDYAALARPLPISIEATQTLLHADEALVLFLDMSAIKPTPEETFVWLVTKTDAREVRIDYGTSTLVQRVAMLRCGLDRESNWIWSESEERWQPRLTACRLLQGAGLTSEEALPFDLNLAHELYQALFGSIADLMHGKQLLIVPSGALSQLPFHVLVTKQPDTTVRGPEAYRRAAWLANEHAITVLPAVSSLKALRENAKASHATKPLIGFGNPLLDGPDQRYSVLASAAREKQQCPKSPDKRLARPHASHEPGKIRHLRGGLADVATIRSQLPLPETADELCAVAHDLGADSGDIHLGSRAREGDIKALSEAGILANYRIVHFATHGALAGQIGDGSEPGLLLTPPQTPSEEDDGYLSASEIVGLKLDADWVVLSACNTAAGEGQGEALSGLGRAFFYAGARALLVSHWAVDSNATVKLITTTLRTMAADKSVGRSEALRRSMVMLTQHGKPYEAHPAYWAPFVVVGEGSPADSTSSQAAGSAMPIAVAPASARKASAKPRPKGQAPWTADIWRRQAN
jgi:CHAT domain-containing protein/tetratricopeptide (TPR) repeat protein